MVRIGVAPNRATLFLSLKIHLLSPIVQESELVYRVTTGKQFANLAVGKMQNVTPCVKG